MSVWWCAGKEVVEFVKHLVFAGWGEVACWWLSKEVRRHGYRVDSGKLGVGYLREVGEGLWRVLDLGCIDYGRERGSVLIKFCTSNLSAFEFIFGLSKS